MNNDFTLCLIVKDEEQFLEHCLVSLRDLATEIIVVDTGSSDRTFEIAASYTGNCIRAEFDGDFSRARNLALERVTTPWIVFLDADERFEAAQAARLHQLLKLIPDNVLALRLLRYNFFATGGFYSGKEIKVFRRHSRIRFRRRINESVKDAVRELGGEIAELPVLLNHFGHCRPREIRESKALRYLDMMRRQLEDQPDDAILVAYIGLILRTLGRFEEACQWSARAVRISPDAARIHQFHGHVLRSCGADKDARAAYERATELDPDDQANWNMLGVMELTLGNTLAAGFAFIKALRADPMAVHVMINQGLIEQCDGRFGRAVQLFEEVARINPAFLHEEWRGRVECDPYREFYYETVMQYAGLAYHLGYCRFMEQNATADRLRQPTPVAIPVAGR
jgi:tetratricopeptide (TPR) repeat protein